MGRCADSSRLAGAMLKEGHNNWGYNLADSLMGGSPLYLSQVPTLSINGADRVEGHEPFNCKDPSGIRLGECRALVGESGVAPCTRS